jgi:tight adherence protein B
MNPKILLAVFSFMGLSSLLTIAVWRTIVRPTGIQDFDAVIATVTGNDTADTETTLLKHKKENESWSWQKWWLEATLKAGRSVSDPAAPGRFMLGATILGSVFGAFVYPGGVVGIYMGVLVIFLARLWLSFEVGKRKAVLERQMPLLLAGLRNQMTAGVTIQRAIMEIADDLPNPIGSEMRQVRDEVRVNVPLTDALEGLNGRVNSRLMQFLVSSIGVAIKSGSDLIPQLITIEEIVRMRARIDGKIRAAVALAKPTAYMAAGAPPLMFVWSMISDPTYLPYFLGKGLLLLLAAVVLYAVGIFLIQIMIKNVENI